MGVASAGTVTRDRVVGVGVGGSTVVISLGVEQVVKSRRISTVARRVLLMVSLLAACGFSGRYLFWTGIFSSKGCFTHSVGIV